MVLQAAAGSCCITSDAWTADKDECLCAVTAHQTIAQDVTAESCFTTNTTCFTCVVSGVCAQGKGTYVSAIGGLPLFTSDTKFNSGTGERCAVLLLRGGCVHVEGWMGAIGRQAGGSTIDCIGLSGHVAGTKSNSSCIQSAYTALKCHPRMLPHVLSCLILSCCRLAQLLRAD